MGKCKYCGQKTGFLSSKHKECEEKYFNGKKEIAQLIETTIVDTADFLNLKTNVEILANEYFIKDEEINSIYTIGFDNAIEIFLEDGILSTDEEENVGKFREKLGLPQEVLDKNGSLQKVFKASILRELTEGNIPEPKINIQGHLPINFQKTEKLVWLFHDVEFYELRTRTQYQGGYSGASIRVAKGLYYRTGSFRGHPVKIEEMKYIDTGLFALTNKHVYFASSSKNFRTPYNKIITIDPYEDGIGIQKDGATAKPQVFKNIDGWFTYNAISNLNQ
jgi:hypothetical protein